MKRCIKLPNGRRVGLGVYVAAWRTLKTTAPDVSIKGFGDWPESAEYVLREMRYGMMDRINKHDRKYGIGRKWSSDWQRETANCARDVNTPRLIVRYVPFHLRARLAHRIWQGE